jgi:hypothetical protein
MGEDGSKLQDVGGMKLEQVLDKLCSDPRIQKVWCDMKEFAEDVQEQLCCGDLSCCMEVCTGTFDKDHLAKCHFHIWLRCSRRIVVPDVTKLSFQGQRPNFAGVIGGIVRETRTASFQGPSTLHR